MCFARSLAGLRVVEVVAFSNSLLARSLAGALVGTFSIRHLPRRGAFPRSTSQLFSTASSEQSIPLTLWRQKGKRVAVKVAARPQDRARQEPSFEAFFVPFARSIENFTLSSLLAPAALAAFPARDITTNILRCHREGTGRAMRRVWWGERTAKKGCWRPFEGALSSPYFAKAI